MSIQLPTYQATPVDSIPSIVSEIRNTFTNHKTRPVEFRLKQLRKLYWAIEDHKEEFRQALRLDLKKGDFDSWSSEIGWAQNDIVYVTKNLKDWCRDEKPADMDLVAKLNRPRIRKDPLGLVLVIGPFNFPMQLTLVPMVGAIAAGNTVILKPSESSPNCAMVLQKIIEASLDPECYRCIQGSVAETKALLAEKWDKIFFTGSAKVGQIVAEAAAKHLTPVTLELGGINPAIVTRNANVSIAAKRLVWAKTMNAGQVCMSQNYTLVEETALEEFVEATKKHLGEMFPNGAKNSEDYSKIVDQRSFDRIKKMLDNTSGRIVWGGTMDAEKRFIEPTVIVVNDPRDSLLVEESFAPFMPIMAVKGVDHAIHVANSIDPTPLGVYPFGSKPEMNKVLKEIRSGGATANDGFVHGCIPFLEFGGTGTSGYGTCRGKASFDNFVNRRAILTVPNWVEPFLAMRYFPQYGTSKLKQYQGISKLKPNFDRDGNEKNNILWLLLTLGAKTAKGGLFRASILAGLFIILKSVMERRSLTAIR